MNALSRVLLATLLALPLSCGSSLFSSDIAELRSDTRYYHGKEVTIRGKVVEATVLMQLRMYTVEDDTGHIQVLTERGVPNVGDTITVTGTFLQVMNAEIYSASIDAMLKLAGGLGKPDDPKRPTIRPNTVQPEMTCWLFEASE